MYKLAYVIRRTILSIFIFAVSERWLIYDCETECGFVSLIYISSDGKGGTENAGVENAGADRRGEKCRSKPYG